MNADDRLATVRSTYDLVAESYASLLPDAGFEAPVDRGMIDAFVTHVTEGSSRSVVDAGCGSGRMTRFFTGVPGSGRVRDRCVRRHDRRGPAVHSRAQL